MHNLKKILCISLIKNTKMSEVATFPGNFIPKFHIFQALPISTSNDNLMKNPDSDHREDLFV